MKKRKLFTLVLSLAVIAYGFSYLSVSKNTVKPDTHLVNLTTDLIDKIIITLPTDLATIQIVDIKSNWIGTQGHITASLKTNKVNAFLAKISKISSSKVEGVSSKEQMELGVSKETGIRIQLFNRENKLDDLVFSNHCNDDRSSYLRMNEGQEVYGINFCISEFIASNFNLLRDEKLTNFSPSQVTSFGWMNAMDESENYFKHENDWKSKREKIRRSQVDKFLKNIYKITSQKFVDDIDEASLDELFIGKLTINGLEMDQAIEISCFYDEDRKLPYIISSSVNPNTYFESDSNQLFKKLFKFRNNSFIKKPSLLMSEKPAKKLDRI